MMVAGGENVVWPVPHAGRRGEVWQFETPQLSERDAVVDPSLDAAAVGQRIGRVRRASGRVLPVDTAKARHRERAPGQRGSLSSQVAAAQRVSDVPAIGQEASDRYGLTATRTLERGFAVGFSPGQGQLRAHFFQGESHYPIRGFADQSSEPNERPGDRGTNHPVVHLPAGCYGRIRSNIGMFHNLVRDAPALLVTAASAERHVVR
jgi:hypothetical protein